MAVWPETAEFQFYVTFTFRSFVEEGRGWGGGGGGTKARHNLAAFLLPCGDGGTHLESVCHTRGGLRQA